MAKSPLSPSKPRSILARLVANFVTDEGGATAIEYCMLASGVGATIAATVFSFGSEIKSNLYDKVAAALR